MHLLIGAVGFAVTVLAAPLVARAGRRFGLLDTPNQRSMHTTPTPRSGGLACMAGMVAALLVGSAMGRPVPWALFALALVLGAVGLVDDRWPLPPIRRLVIQAAAGIAAGLIMGGGLWILLGVIALPVAVNVLNFMDGINGITCLTMLVWSVAMAVAGVLGGVPELAMLGVAAAGSAAGFLPWNAPRARAFLGDGGSYLFGAVVGIGSILGASGQVSVGVLVGPMIIYLADTGSTLIRRAIRREPLLRAHRSHVYQRLVRRTGWPHLAVSGLVAGLSLAITAAYFAPHPWIGVAVSVIAVAVYLISPEAWPWATRRTEEAQ